MCNIGKLDKFIRVVLSYVIMGVGIYHQNFWGMLGLIPLTTAAVGICPLYMIFKINTGCKKEKLA